MKTIAWLIACVSILILVHSPVLAADIPQVTYPKTGEALQGLVIVNGNSNLPGFQSAEIAFNYSSSNPDTWFLIQHSSSPVRDAALAVWDTTTIADGTYRLRVKVFLQDGKSSEVVIMGLRVRNYTPIETNTPQPVRVTELAAATATPISVTLTPRRTPTALPLNPVSIGPLQLAFGWIQGAAAALIGLGMLGLYKLIRRR